MLMDKLGVLSFSTSQNCYQAQRRKLVLFDDYNETPLAMVKCSVVLISVTTDLSLTVLSEENLKLPNPEPVLHFPPQA